METGVHYTQESFECRRETWQGNANTKTNSFHSNEIVSKGRAGGAVPVPDDGLSVMGLLLGLFSRLHGGGDDGRLGLLGSNILIAQYGRLLREIHVLHERHAALQRQQPLLRTDNSTKIKK